LDLFAIEEPAQRFPLAPISDQGGKREVAALAERGDKSDAELAELIALLHSLTDALERLLELRERSAAAVVTDRDFPLLAVDLDRDDGSFSVETVLHRFLHDLYETRVLIRREIQSGPSHELKFGFHFHAVLRSVRGFLGHARRIGGRAGSSSGRR